MDLSAFRALAAPVGPVRVIGAIGRLDDQKGFDILVRAFRRTTNPGIALHIYGEGAQEGRLRALAEDDPRILFKGFAPEPVAAMAAVDAVAMPSRWEAYGLVAIEALAAQRPLLVNGIDGLSDHVPNGARQVAGQDVQSWQEALETLTDVNAPASQTLAENSASPERVFETAWVALLNRARLG